MTVTLNEDSLLFDSLIGFPQIPALIRANLLGLSALLKARLRRAEEYIEIGLIDVGPEKDGMK